MNTLIYTVLKKKRLWLFYSFFVCRLNLSGLQVLSEKQLKHKTHPRNLFSSCPSANRYLDKLQQLKRTAVLRKSSGKAGRQELKYEEINFHNTADSER